MKRGVVRASFVLAFCLLLLAFSPAAQALTFNLDTEFSGGNAPAGTSPWLTATFTTISPGSVQLNLSAANLTGSEFVTDWLFNLNPALNPDSLSFAYVSGVAASSITTGADFDKADGAGFFDITLSFPTSNSDPDARLSVGDASEYIISGISALTEDDFNYLSTESAKGQFHTAAHIQGIGPDGEGSGWIGDGNVPPPIPEPSTWMLFGSGLLGTVFYLRRKRAQ